MKVLLVGNYPFDQATSMHVFAQALERELPARGIAAELIAPRPFFGRLRPSATGFGKWLGYIDRYVLFPRALRAAAARADVVHLCEQGSAMYARMLDGTPTLVTCHDLLAVRGALGELEQMRGSRLAIYLQRWICAGLKRAAFIACDSTATIEDARRILGRSGGMSVVLLSLNYPFQALPDAEAERRLSGISGLEKPFLFHVGANHPRKNRDGILRVFARVACQSRLRMVFAGRPLSSDLLGLAHELGVEDRIVQVNQPGVQVLEALYNRALALIFPSRSEGFGWPPIEAQACGCPVVASDIQPLTEVLGQSAILHHVDDEPAMAASVARLASDAEYRQRIRQLGLENVRSRFQTARMIDDYISLYREIALHN